MFRRYFESCIALAGGWLFSSGILAAQITNPNACFLEFTLEYIDADVGASAVIQGHGPFELVQAEASLTLSGSYAVALWRTLGEVEWAETQTWNATGTLQVVAEPSISGFQQVPVSATTSTIVMPEPYPPQAEPLIFMFPVDDTVWTSETSDLFFYQGILEVAVTPIDPAVEGLTLNFECQPGMSIDNGDDFKPLDPVPFAGITDVIFSDDFGFVIGNPNGNPEFRTP